MSILPGLLIIATFGVFAAMMMSRRMPALLALPCMAVIVALISGAFYDWSQLPAESEFKDFWSFIQVHVMTKGAARLAEPIMYTVFGSILSQLVIRAGIAQRIVSVAAEYAGDRKMVLAGLLTLVVAFSFTSLTGLGAVIMLGSLVLPILLGAGLSAEFCACLMLFAIATGGIFNPAILGNYETIFQVQRETVQHYVMLYGGLLALTTLMFFIVEGRKEKSYAWSVVTQAPPSTPMSPLALLTPILPIALLLISGLLHDRYGIGYKWEIIPAFVVGIVFGALTTDPKRALQNVTAATLEGLKDVAPVLGLFIGIGMALNAMMAEPTKVVMAPFLVGILPKTSLTYVLFFTLLAPLALYRGPLNFFGLGAGIAALILGAKLMPAVALMAAFFAVGQIQGVCDPTNTSNVWLATFTKSSTERFLKRTLPYVWGFVAVALAYAALGAGVMR
jgi:hypothetical protein